MSQRGRSLQEEQRGEKRHPWQEVGHLLLPMGLGLRIFSANATGWPDIPATSGIRLNIDVEAAKTPQSAGLPAASLMGGSGCLAG